MTHAMHQIADNHWICPECGREILMTLDPYSRIVINPGNEGVVHTGGTGGLVMSADITDPYLEPFEEWMSKRQ